MSKGILRIDADIVAEWFVAGKTKEDTKSLLKLPEHYDIDEVAMDETGMHLQLTVSSTDIPEVAEHLKLPEIEATWSKNQDEQGQWHIPESYRLIGLKATIDLPKE